MQVERGCLSQESLPRIIFSFRTTIILSMIRQQSNSWDSKELSDVVHVNYQ